MPKKTNCFSKLTYTQHHPIMVSCDKMNLFPFICMLVSIGLIDFKQTSIASNSCTTLVQRYYHYK